MDPRLRMERDALKHVVDPAATLSQPPLSFFNQPQAQVSDYVTGY